MELSTGYHQVDIRNYQWLMDICEAYDESIPAAFRASMERMHTVNVLLMMPDGRLPDLNDGGWHEVAPFMEHAVKDYPHRADFRWTWTRGAQGAPPAGSSHAFPYAGHYVMRSGWAPDAVWAVFDGGHFGYGHQHEDKLNLLLHAYGRLLLTEGGNYAYDTSEMRRYVLSTRSHNTIRVDGQDQNRRLHYNRETFDVKAPSAAAWRTIACPVFPGTEEYDVAEASYDEGYGPAADRTVTHRRQLLFLKRPAGDHGLGAYWVVVDRLIPADAAPHRYQMIWHLNADAVETAGTVVRSVDSGQPNLAILPAALSGLAVTVVAGQEAPEWQGWRAIKNHQQGEYAPTPTALYEWQATGPVRLVTILFPTRPGGECPIAAVVASTAVEDTAIRLVLADGSSVHLIECPCVWARNVRWTS